MNYKKLEFQGKQKLVIHLLPSLVKPKDFLEFSSVKAIVFFWLIHFSLEQVRNYERNEKLVI